MELPIELWPAGDFALEGKRRIDSGEKKELIAIDGVNRWVFTREDGTQYLFRPEPVKE